MARKAAPKDTYVSPARATLLTLHKLDRALMAAQDHAGSLSARGAQFSGASKLGSDAWEEFEKLRWKIRKMAERAERSGGLFG